MFWAGFAIGIFLGGTLGVVVAGLFAASRRTDVDEPWGNPRVDRAVMDEVKAAPLSAPQAARLRTYLDDSQ